MIKEYMPKGGTCPECNIALKFERTIYSIEKQMMMDCEHDYSIESDEQYDTYPDVIQYKCSKCDSTAGYQVGTKEWLTGIPMQDLELLRCPKCHKLYQRKIYD